MTNDRSLTPTPDEANLRRSGLDVLGRVPWGTHVCQFYASGQDLIETLVPYFSEGLRSNEYCMWVTSAPLKVGQAMEALRAATPDLDDYLACGQIEILDYSQWYARTGAFDADAVLQGWADKLAEARRRGFEGLRLTGNTFWLEQADWENFARYEEKVNGVIGGERMLALCTYALEKCGVREILDVIANHQFALVKRAGRWEVIERSEQVRMELALRKSEERLRLATRAAGLGVFEWDVRADRSVWENSRMYEICGRSEAEGPFNREEFLARVIHPDDADAFEAAMAEAMKPGREFHTTCRIRRRDGQVRWVEHAGRFEHSLDGEPLRLLGVLADITERKRAEQALAEHTRHLEFLSDTAMQLHTLSTPEEIFRFAARQLRRVSGDALVVVNEYDPDRQTVTVRDVAGDETDLERVRTVLGADLVGLRFAFPPETGSRMAEGRLARVEGGLHDLTLNRMPEPLCRAIEAALGIGEIYAMPFVLEEDLMGTLAVLLRRGRPRPNLSAVETFVSNVAVLLKRRRAEGALRGSEQRLRLALQGADGGVWDWNLRTGQAWWSDEMYALWGVEPGLPMPLESSLAVVHEQDREPLRRAIEDSIARRTDFRHEFRICHPVRGERWMASSGRLMDDDSGPAARLLGITLDVTDRKRAEEQLRQSTAELRAANTFLLDSRRAALNLMDDALADRRRAEAMSAALRQEIAERKRAEDLLRLSETTIRQQLAEIEATYASAPIGLCVLDADLRYVRVNERLAEINGLPAAAHLGRTFREVVPHVADQAEALMRRVIETGVPLLDVEIGGETAAQSGVRREWLEHWLPIKDIAGRVVGLNIVAEEVTARKRADTIGRFLESTSGALAASLDYEATLETVARMGASTLADGCVVDLIEPEWAGRRLLMVAGDPSLVDLARELSGCYPIPPEGHPADRAFRTGRPAFFAEVADDALSRIAPGPEYLGRLRQAGIASMLIVPLKVHDRILGSIGLVTRGARRLTPHDVPALEEFARRASLAIERARLYEAERAARAYAEAAQSRLGLLVEASERLAESLDYEITLGNAARLLVPALADWCAIDLIQPDGRVRRSHVLAADPERGTALAEALREHSPSLAWTDHPISRVLLTQEPVLIDSPSVDDIRRSTRSPEHFEVIRRLNPKSLVIVPLVTRVRTVGAMTLVMSESGRRHTPDDLGLAQEVARRAAMAVDNSLLYREAQDAIRLREEFLSIASHELRTPMTVLRGDTEALNRILERAVASNGLPKGEAAVSLDRNRLAGALERMDRASQRMARLVEELLDVNRLKHGSLSLRPERMDLCALLIGVVEGTRQRLLSDSRTRAMALDLRLPECQSVWGHWDPGRLEQVLVNLIDNAVKYSPSDGVVGVEMALQPGNGQEPVRRVHLVVCDQGIGIPPEERESIFEPFSRASNAAASNFPGLGLGLAISREIVRLHGGRIWVESGGDGRGSQFHVVLPGASGQ